MRRSLDRVDAERFVHEAEGCFRCARIPGIKSEIAEGLEVAGHELMAAAVAIETELQRAKKPQPGSASPLCDLLEKHAKTLIRISYGVKESEVAEAIEEVAYALRAVAREHPSAPHVDCSGSS
jgi:hypothetical protein